MKSLRLLLATGALLIGCAGCWSDYWGKPHWWNSAQLSAFSGTLSPVTNAFDHPRFIPDPRLTPGVVNPRATAAALRSPAFIKASRSVSESEKREVFRRYGIDWSARDAYEVDHYVPLCVGGMNTLSNLWPEPWKGRFGARVKDRLEVYAHKQVNRGALTIGQAQALFLNDAWTNSYVKIFGNPGVGQKVFAATHNAVK